MAVRRSSARSDDFAKTLASIRRQLCCIPADRRRRAEFFTTLTYVARLYVRREIRSAEPVNKNESVPCKASQRSR